MEITGSFEAHLTLDAPDLGRVVQYAQGNGLKVTHIVLGEGKHPSQPMLTRRMSGELPQVLGEAKAISASLQELGVETLRIKLETSIENAVVPGDDKQAAVLPGFWHFEHHVKLLLRGPGDGELAASSAERHSARLSRNALRESKAGGEERFLTQRCYQMGRRSAQERLTALLHELSIQKITVLESEAEYVVYDSNVALDSGWMPTPLPS